MRKAVIILIMVGLFSIFADKRKRIPNIPKATYKPISTEERAAMISLMVFNGNPKNKIKWGKKEYKAEVEYQKYLRNK